MLIDALTTFQDDDPAAPWNTDPMYGGPKNRASMRRSWEAAQVAPEPQDDGSEAPASAEDLPRDNIPPATSPLEFGLPTETSKSSEDASMSNVTFRPPALKAFPVEWLDDIVASEEPTQLIRGILPMGPALGVMFGPPKTLKSMLASLMGLHIAAALPFGGREVQTGGVAWVTSEGINGARRRLVASRRALGIEGRRVPFAFIPVMPNLGAGQDDRLRLQTAIENKIKPLGVPLRMIILDTLRRAMPGKSENKPEDVSVVVDNCDALARHFGCFVLLIHHSPRSTDDRGSGSNLADAAADVMLSVKREEGARRATATVKMAKDAEEGATWDFELRTMEIGIDRQGHAITGAFVELCSEPGRLIAGAKRAKLSPAQQHIFDILTEALIAEGKSGAAGEAAPPTTVAVSRETLKAYCKKKGWWDSSDKETEKSSRTRLGARLTELAGKHAIGLTDEYVWQTTGATGEQQ